MERLAGSFISDVPVVRPLGGLRLCERVGVLVAAGGLEPSTSRM